MTDNKEKTYYVTTPIYYANGSPHIGHFLTTTIADVLARYHRLRIGASHVFFTTGLDEHGTTVEQSATKAGYELADFQKYTDKRAVEWEQAFDETNISYDYFVRTTNVKHKKHAQNFIQVMVDAGDVYKSTYKGKYCNGCEKFLTLSDMDENGLCPNHRPDQVIETEEDNYFFKLSKYASEIKNLITTGTISIKPESKRNEMLARLDGKIDDISISRPKEKVAWGVEFPGDINQTIYVWVEALMNYTSSLEIHNKQSYWSNSYHILGKDINWFHNVIWPAFLLAAKKDLYNGAFVHSFLNISGTKISKSLGNIITPKELVDKFSVDGARYLILTSSPHSNDTDVTWEHLDNKYQADLANGLGNLVSRVAGMVKKYFDGKVPEINRDPHEHPLFSGAGHTWKKAWKVVDESIEVYDFNKALASIWEFISTADKYIDDTKPWELAKNDTKDELAWVLYGLCDAIQQLAWQINCFLPETSTKIANAFKIEELLVDNPTYSASWTNIKSGKTIKLSTPLFPRLEAK